jgi:predicted SAM-dependent methyltransferase
MKANCEKKLMKMILQKLRTFNSFIIFLFKVYIYNTRKLDVGSSGINWGKGWVLTDIELLDITLESNWIRLFGGIRLTNIMAEHVWEHLTESDTYLANKNCHKFLKSGGVLRIAVPDGYHPDKSYISWVKVGGNGPGADDHKILYNYIIMKENLEKAGFRVILIEYWDEAGKFHYIDWSHEAGFIRRSKNYDERNSLGELKYTSLIVDAIKV